MHWNLVQDPLLGRLRARLERRPCPVVPLVGAGLSARCGLPLFHGLVARLIEYAGDVGADRGSISAARLALEGEDLPRAALHARQALGESRYVDVVRALLTPGAEADLTLHEIVAGWAPPVVLTTNLDEALERAFRAAGRELTVWADVRQPAPPIPEDGARTLLVKIHGTLSDPATWVLTSADYQRRLFHEARSFEAFWSGLRARDLLVLGYALADRDLVDPLEWIAWREWSREESVFVLLPHEQAEAMRPRMQRIGAWLIGYSSDDAHAELEDALRSLLGLAPRVTDLGRRGALAVQALKRLLDPHDLRAPGIQVSGPPGMIAWLAAQIPAHALASLHDAVSDYEKRAGEAQPGWRATLKLRGRSGGSEVTRFDLSPTAGEPESVDGVVAAAEAIHARWPRLATALLQEAVRLIAIGSTSDKLDRQLQRLLAWAGDARDELDPNASVEMPPPGESAIGPSGCAQLLHAARFLTLCTQHHRQAAELAEAVARRAQRTRDRDHGRAVALHARTALLEGPEPNDAEFTGLRSRLHRETAGLDMHRARLLLALAEMRAVALAGVRLGDEPGVAQAAAESLAGRRDGGPDEALVVPLAHLARSHALREFGRNEQARNALAAAEAGLTELLESPAMAEHARWGLARVAEGRAELALDAGDPQEAVRVATDALRVGGLPPTIVGWLELAAARGFAAMRRFEEAGYHLREAEARVRTRDDVELAMRVAAEAEALRTMLGDGPRGANPFVELERLARESHRKVAALQARIRGGEWLADAGRPQEAMALLERARSALGELGEGKHAVTVRALAVEGDLLHARLLMEEGRHVEAAQVLWDVAATAQALSAVRPRLFGEFLRLRARSARDRGRFSEARATYGQALLLAARLRDVTREVYLHMALSELARARVDAPVALAHAEAARARFADLQGIDPQAAATEPNRRLAAELTLTRAMALLVGGLAVEAQQEAEKVQRALPERAGGGERPPWLARAGKAQMVIGLALTAQARALPEAAERLRTHLLRSASDNLWRAVNVSAAGGETLDAALSLRLYADLQLALRDEAADRRVVEALRGASQWPVVKNARASEARLHYLRSWEKATRLIEAVGADHAAEVLGADHPSAATWHQAATECAQELGWDPDEARRR
jgi:tetratricopeptide (TPR) repeat protein